MVEDVDDNVDEVPDTYFSKATAILFDKTYNLRYGVLPLSKFVDLVETVGGGGFIVSSCQVICVKYTQMKVVVWNFLHL